MSLSFMELKNVHYRYPRTSFAIKNVSLTFSTAEIAAIVGPNGSGKTTLSKLMAGIIEPDSGNVTINGLSTAAMSLGAIGKKIGYLFQQPDRQIFSLTVFDELAFVLRLRGVEESSITLRVEKALEQFHLSHLREALPFSLSRGEKQRLAIAAILMQEPSFLIFDEPTSSLDQVRRDVLSQLLSTLHRQGVGMAIISHDYSFIERHATRIICMVGGEVVDDYRP